MATLAGAHVLAATVSLPLTGVWHADVVVDTETDLSGSVTLKDETVELSATVAQGAVFAGRWKGRVVGGAGGMGKLLKAKAYREVFLAVPVADIMVSTGEVLSGNVGAAVLADFVQHWQRAEQRAGAALSAIVIDEAGLNWRVGIDGNVWIGADLFSEQTLDGTQVLEDDPAKKRLLVAPPTIALEPGRSFEGKNVSRVVHRIEPARVRTELWYE